VGERQRARPSDGLEDSERVTRQFREVRPRDHIEERRFHANSQEQVERWMPARG
jgi:hypothetical protein